jgi:autotransporter-associated beta strand protein
VTNSVKMGGGVADTITITGTAGIATGGVLVSATAGAFAQTITGGTLTSGNTNSDGTHDLILINNDATAGGNLIVNSGIVNNGSNAVGLTLATTNESAELGLIELGGNNTFTGAIFIDAAKVTLEATTAFNGNNLTFAPEGLATNTTNVGTLSLNGFSNTIGALSTSAVTAFTSPIVQDAAATSAVLTLNTPRTSTFTGTVRNGTGNGTLGITLTGGGTETLAGSNTYTGATTITNGTLIFTSSIPTSSFSIAGGSTLNTSAAGTLTLGSGQTLSTSAASGATATVTGAAALSGGNIATGAASSTLQVTSLTVSSGALSFSITDPTPTTGASGLINVTASNGLTINGGTVNLSGASFSSGTTYSIVYDLFQYSGTLGGTGPGALVVSPASEVNGLTYAFGTSGGYVTLTVTGNPLFTANWITDASTGSWATSANWDNGVPNGQYDTANFGGAASTHSNLARTVTLDGSQTVGVLSFASPNGESYTISQGSGGSLTLDNGTNSASIAVGGTHVIDSTVAVSLNSNLTVGSTLSTDKLTIGGVISNGSGDITTNTGNSYATLNKTGPGILVLNGANTYGPSAGTVGTTLGGGTVQVGNSSAFGSSNVSFGGSATVQAGANGLTLGNNFIIGTGNTGTFDAANNTLAVSGLLSGGGALTVISSTAGGTVAISNNETYSGGTTINPGATLSIGNGTTAGSVTGAITNNGTLAFTRSDSGTVTVGNTISGIGSVVENSPTAGNILQLTSANTYTGGTTITAGEIQLGNAAALGAGDVNTGSNSSNLLDLAGYSPTFGALNGAGSINSSAAGTISLVLGSDSVNGAFTGAIQNTNGTVSVFKEGSGTQSLTGNNTYSGGTTIYQGGLTIGGNSDMVGAGNLDLIGAQGTNYGYVDSLTIENNAIISTTGYLRLASNDGQNSNNYPGSGTVLIENNAQVTVGSFAFGSGSRVGTGNAITIQNTASLTVNGAFDLLHDEGSTLGSIGVTLNGGTLALDNFIESGGGSAATPITISLNGGALEALASDPSGSVFFLPSTLPNVTVSVGASGAIINTNGFNDTIAHSIVHGAGTPDGGLTKNGAGTLYLTGANSYTGLTTINAGTLNINGEFALGGAVYGGTVFNGGTLQYLAALPGTNGTGDITQTSGGTAEAVTINASGATIDTDGNAITYAHALGGGGSGSLTVADTAGTGSLTLDAAASYTGATTINSGATLKLGDGTTGHDGTIASSSSITDNGNLVYNRYGANSTSLAINGSGNVTVSGPGSQTLATSSGYTGTTTVSAGGTLIVTGGLSATSGVTASGAVEADAVINSSVNLTGGTLSGNGGSVGTVTSTAGKITPGDTIGSTAAGTLSATNVSLDSNSTFSIRVGVQTETDFDALNVSGTISLGGASLLVNDGPSVNDSSLADIGDLYVIINGGAGATGSGSDIFGNLNTSGSVPTYTTNSGLTFDVLYAVTPTSETTFTTGGNDVALQLVSVPEPGTWASLIGGLGMLLVWQRSRRRRSSI